MKFKIYKFLLLVILLTSANVANLQAKTFGNYLTLKASHNIVNIDPAFTQTTGIPAQSPTVRTIITSGTDSSINSSNQSIGIAFSRSLRLNRYLIFNKPIVDRIIGEKIKNIFVKYGAFYDHLNYTNFANNKQNISINSRYGIDLGLGYDLSRRFSIYSSVGLASVDYEIDSRSVSFNDGNNGTESNRKVSPIITAGLNYQINKNIFIGLEYSIQEIKLESAAYAPTLSQSANKIERYTFDTKIESISATITKHF